MRVCAWDTAGIALYGGTCWTTRCCKRREASGAFAPHRALGAFRRCVHLLSPRELRGRRSDSDMSPDERLAEDSGRIYHFPEEVLRVRLPSPVDDAHPVATAPGQLASERVAFGAANGVNEPATAPFFTTMSARLAAPVTLKAGGLFVQLVGLKPAGVVQVILNLEPAAGAGSVTPLKMVAQLLAVPGMLNVSVPLMVPSATMPAVVTHELPVLPRVAFTVNVSVLAVPPFMSGGAKVITPLQTPPAGLHVTWPGMLVGLETALATPDSAATMKSDDNAVAPRMRMVFLAIWDPVSGRPPVKSRGGLTRVCPKDSDRTSGAPPASGVRRVLRQLRRYEDAVANGVASWKRTPRPLWNPAAWLRTWRSPHVRSECRDRTNPSTTRRPRWHGVRRFRLLHRRCR